jgi:hypothetical protein
MEEIGKNKLTSAERKHFGYLAGLVEITLQFQNYMLRLGYTIQPRESLLSTTFPTTFTPSGGPNLVEVFKNNFPFSSIITNQPCIRHWDIELVGDSKHLSFFNMFVTACDSKGFSRSEMIHHFIFFFTKYLHLDISRIYGCTDEGKLRAAHPLLGGSCCPAESGVGCLQRISSECSHMAKAGGGRNCDQQTHLHGNLSNDAQHHRGCGLSSESPLL